VRTVLVTGAGGFVGRRLAARLDPTAFAVRAAGRSAEIPMDLPGRLPPDAALAGVDAVVHLAAATGKVREAAHFAVNAEGTEALLKQAARCGVRDFLFVSTVAAGFADVRRYPYARSKQRAEAAVAAGGLRYTIVRPTLVAGRGGGAWEGLAKLARLPASPVFGDGATPLQPVHVDDLADALAAVLRDGRFAGETLDVGGPERVPIGELIRKLRAAQGRAAGRVLRLPLGLTRGAVGLVEDVVGPVLPITAGQLSTFGEDGTARPNDLADRLRPGMKTVDEMIALTFGGGSEENR
jgi:NADH dehydrogenase